MQISDRRAGRSSRRPAGGRRSRLTITGLLGVALLLLAGCAEDAKLDTLKPKGPAAQDIQNLVTPVFAIAGVILVLVLGGILLIVVRYRERPNDDGTFPAQTHGNFKLEITWTIVPAVILVVVAVLTVFTLFELEEREDDALEVSVYGQQWWWEFDYDADQNGTTDFVTANDLVVPAGREIDLTITSRDVIHSFWIPALNGKKDAVPGRQHSWKIEADEPGVYYGQCTEFCGLSHGMMRMRVVALEPDAYDRWVQGQLQPAATPTDPLAREGLVAFQSLCASCHLINGVNNDTYEGAAQVSGVAPNLTHFAGRTSFIGGVYDLYDEQGNLNVNQLEEWLRNPNDVKPMMPDDGRGMPDLGLTEAQISALVAYLRTLS